MDIDTMPAGREMNERIAEEVMGLVRGKDWHWPCLDDLFCDNPCRNYSGGWAEAGEVVEAVRQQKAKCWVAIRNIALPPDYVVDGWDVIFHEYGKPLRDRAAIYGHGMAERLPHAICRAALKAVT